MRSKHVSKNASDLERRYAREGFPLGLTIAEWEAREGLPLFSVWPEAEFARDVRDPGYFLYSKATPEERALMMGRDTPRCTACGVELSRQTKKTQSDFCTPCARANARDNKVAA